MYRLAFRVCHLLAPQNQINLRLGSVMEIQTILAELVEHFEFTSPKGQKILRVQAGPIMILMVSGKRGSQMPLHVTPVVAVA